MPSGPDCCQIPGAIDRRHTLNRISKCDDLTSGWPKMTKLTSIVCAESTEQATENHQDTSDRDGKLATPSISEERPNSSQRASLVFSTG